MECDTIWLSHVFSFATVFRLFYDTWILPSIEIRYSMLSLPNAQSFIRKQLVMHRNRRNWLKYNFGVKNLNISHLDSGKGHKQHFLTNILFNFHAGFELSDTANTLITPPPYSNKYFKQYSQFNKYLSRRNSK